MKTCTKCHQEKSLSEYYRQGARASGYRERCKTCTAQYQHENRVRFRPVKLKYAAKQRDLNRAWVCAYLASRVCIDCGEANPIVLQFDHVRGEKIGNVSRMIQDAASLEKIQAEIAKCDIRCGNCHLIVTHQRAGWTKCSA